MFPINIQKQPIIWHNVKKKVTTNNNRSMLFDPDPCLFSILFGSNFFRISLATLISL
jgi:hypothetical protein